MKDFYELTRSFGKNPHIATEEDFNNYHELTANHNCFNISKNVEIPFDYPSSFARSVNMVIVGSSASGKTQNFSLPLIKQMKTSMVIEDTGYLYDSCKDYLEKNGGKVLNFNLADPKKSNAFNPLLNLYKSNGKINNGLVDMLVSIISDNDAALNSEDVKAKDVFFDKVEKYLLTVGIYYMLEHDDIPKEKKTFKTLYEYFLMGNTFLLAVKDFVDNIKSDGDTAECYKELLSFAPQKTLETVLLICATRLSSFATDTISKLTTYDENENNNINFIDLIKEKTYLFVILPTNSTELLRSRTLLQIFYAQAYYSLYYWKEENEDILCNSAKEDESKSIPVNFLYDEFALMPKIISSPIIMSCRIYGIGNQFVIQSFDQLKHIYGDDFELLMAYSDTVVYMGSFIKSDREYFQKLCGCKPMVFGRRRKKPEYIVSDDDLNLANNGKVIIWINDLAIFIDDRCNSSDSE